MTYRIDLTRRAARALSAIDKPERRRVLSVIDRLSTDPRPPGCVKLAGWDGQWRVRAGDYQVIYEVRDDRLLVLVVEIGHRSTVARETCTGDPGLAPPGPGSGAQWSRGTHVHGGGRSNPARCRDLAAAHSIRPVSSASSPVAVRSGYALAPAAFVDDDLADLRDATDTALQRMLRAASTADRERTTTVWPDGHHLQEIDGTTIHWEPEAPDVVRSLAPVTQLDPRLAALCADRRVTGPACEVLGVPDVAMVHSALNLKAAGVGSEYRWHQDTLTPPAVNVMIFLDDARVDNGPLSLLPGSHRAGFLPLDPADPIARYPDPSLVDDGGEVVITATAGTVLAFSVLLLHRSSANRSRFSRRALRLCFAAASTADQD